MRDGGASRTARSGLGLGRRAQGVESLPQRQLINPEITGIGHRPESLLEECLTIRHGPGHDSGHLAVPMTGLQHFIDGLEVGRVGELPGDAKGVGQVEVTDPEDVDAVNSRDGLGVLDARPVSIWAMRSTSSLADVIFSMMSPPV